MFAFSFDSWFFFLILKKKSFEIALNLARKTFAPKLPKEKEKWVLKSV